MKSKFIVEPFTPYCSYRRVPWRYRVDWAKLFGWSFAVAFCLWFWHFVLSQATKFLR